MKNNFSLLKNFRSRGDLSREPRVSRSRRAIILVLLHLLVLADLLYLAGPTFVAGLRDLSEEHGARGSPAFSEQRLGTDDAWQGHQDPSPLE